MPTPHATQPPSSPIKVLNTQSILDAAEDSRPLSPAETVHLLSLEKEADLARLKQVAHLIRARQAGNPVHYQANVSLFLTNRCEMAPLLYAYPRPSGAKGLYTLTIDDIDATLERAKAHQIDSLTLSGGGFNSLLSIPGLEAPTALKSYVKLLVHIREHYPQLKISGFSPDEIEFLCVLENRNAPYLLELLIDHGLSGLHTFGTEILVDSVRERISPKKATVKRWLEIVKTAVQLDLPIFMRLEAGPVETLSQRVRHLEVLRQFCDKNPRAFSRLIPQMWNKPAHQSMPVAGNPLTNHTHRLKLIAVTRLFLGEHIPQQQVIWIPDQVTEAQEALSWGANDFGSTDATAYYRFLAGYPSVEALALPDLESIIQETGYPLQPQVTPSP